MYLGIDVGGTKTLVAVLTDEGVVKESVKFATPQSYDEFITDLRQTMSTLKHQDFRAGTIAAPGNINRKTHFVESLGNLGWKNINILRDVEPITGCPMRLENDAKLGGLSEAMLLKDKYRKVLYITISTGIGIGLVENGIIDTTVGDGGGRAMMLEHHGKLMPWEEFASGSAIVRKYGKMASEIEDQKIWKDIVRLLSPGIVELVAILDPEVIVIGGGVGHHFDKFGSLLISDLKKYETPMLQMPPIVGAQRAEEAVIYGCYDYARQKYA